MIASWACLRNSSAAFLKSGSRLCARSIIERSASKHHRQVGLELLDRFAELGDLGALVAEEEIE